MDAFTAQIISVTNTKESLNQLRKENKDQLTVGQRSHKRSENKQIIYVKSAKTGGYTHTTT